MSLRFFEIAEANHRIQNPLDDEKLMLLGEICRLDPSMRVLDLACGKGELLSRWARTSGIRGVGVDISPVFLEAARARADELHVADRLAWVQGDAASYVAEPQTFDIVSCLGASWIGNGIHGTIRLMRPAVKPDGLLLVGEPYWIKEPPEAAYDALGMRRDDYCSLDEFLGRCKAAEVELVEMVLANHDTWDRYEAMHWMTVSDYLRDHPDDTDAAALRQWMQHGKQVYLEYGRRYLGWGVFVLRPLWQR